MDNIYAVNLFLNYLIIFFNFFLFVILINRKFNRKFPFPSVTLVKDLFKHFLESTIKVIAF